MSKTLEFLLTVELARELVKNAENRNLYDAEIAAIQCAWEHIEYDDFSKNTKRFTAPYRRIYRYPDKNKKKRTLNSSGCRIFKTFSEKYDLKFIRNNFKQNILELMQSGTIDVSPYRLAVETAYQEYELVETDKTDDLHLDPILDKAEITSLVQRTIEIGHVEDLLNQYPILVLYGSPGVGKSTFANQFIGYVDAQYQSFSSDLRYIDSFLQWGYEILSQAKITDEISVDRLVAKLSELIQSKPTLFVIDSISQLDSEFAGFFEMMSIRNKESIKIILLSNRKITPKISTQYLTSYHLKGLQEKDEINEFFCSLRLKSPQYWMKMNTFYEGNFRQIIYASSFINDFFDGDVAAYWESNSRVFTPDMTQDLEKISENISTLDERIFSMFSDEDNVISANIMKALKQGRGTSEIWTRISYLCELGYLNVGRTNNRLTYSIAPMLKAYLIQKEII